MALLPYAAQLLLIIHAIRTGQNFNWIWLLVFLPGLGALIYFIMVILPDLRDRGSQHLPAVRAAINPLGTAQKLQTAWELSPTPHNRLQLALEFLRLEQWDQAASHLEALLQGYFKGDRELSLQLARCRFQSGAPAAALALYDAVLSPAAPGNTSQEACHLACAWAVRRDPAAAAGLGRIFRANDDLECGWHYARCLKDQGLEPEIQAVLDRMKLVAAQHRSFRKTMDTRWIAAVSKLLKD